MKGQLSAFVHKMPVTDVNTCYCPMDSWLDSEVTYTAWLWTLAPDHGKASSILALDRIAVRVTGPQGGEDYLC